MSLARQSDRPYHCPLLVEAFTQFLKLPTPKKASTPQWAEHFSKQLKALGWPGERQLCSEEYQLVTRFENLLKEFANLELIQRHMTFDEAWNQLQQLVQNTLFQSETPPNKPIQVLGSLEASGLHFDYCWIMGMSDQNWPPPPSPHPFIPIHLQRQLGLPHASVQSETHFAKLLTERFTQTGNKIIFSHSNQLDNISLSTSTLIKKYPEITQHELKLQDWKTPAKTIFIKKLPREMINDDMAPAVTTDEIFYGGTRILEMQSTCPFQAYAKIRLGAKTIPLPSDSLTAAERGKAIHAALAHVWNHIKTHHKLIQLSTDEKENIINQSIKSALLEITRDKPLILKSRYCQIEHQRLFEQIQDWLELEKQRSPFQVVAIEQSHSTQIGKLTLNLRIDRIDQSENGGFLIIDYKTGKFSTYDLLTEKPSQLQLPIYAVTSDKPVSGVIFAQIRADTFGFYGVGESNFNISTISVTENWISLQQKWKQTLIQLSDEFYQGKAAVNPKNPEVCRQCDLQPLCRIKSNLKKELKSEHSRLSYSK